MQISSKEAELIFNPCWKPQAFLWKDKCGTLL